MGVIDQRGQQAIAEAFFALHDPLRQALQTDDQAELAELTETVRELVHDTIAARTAATSATTREELRQLTWIATQHGSQLATPLRDTVAEWDQLLAVSLTAAAARQATAASQAHRTVLSERVLELLADREMRPSQIATELNATRSQISRALRQLRDEERLEAIRHPHDGRGYTYRAVQTRIAA